jgi:hypothetical protein
LFATEKNPAFHVGTAGCRGTTLIHRCLPATASITYGRDGLSETLASGNGGYSGRVYWRPWRVRLATLGPFSPTRGVAAFQLRGSLWTRAIEYSSRRCINLGFPYLSQVVPTCQAKFLARVCFEPPQSVVVAPLVGARIAATLQVHARRLPAGPPFSPSPPL